jgi:hypothetical protein
VALVSIDGEPSCFQEEIKVSESGQWKKDMKEEMDSLERNKTWDLVELPKDRKVVDCKWVYKLKRVVDDKVKRYKANLVVKGYSQKEDDDIYMEQPEGFVKDRNKRFVCKLKRSLCGLR